MKRWIRASMPGPACLVQKPMVFAQEARHLRRRGTSCASQQTRSQALFQHQIRRLLTGHAQPLRLWRPPHGQAPNVARPFNSNSREAVQHLPSEYTFNPIKVHLIIEVGAYLLRKFLIFINNIICYG